MEIFNELFGVPGLAGALGAGIIFISKELFSSFVRKNEKKTESVIEFKNYKQKALFDKRFNTYSDIYSKMKEMEGTIKSFEDVYWISETKIESAFYSENNMKYFNGLAEDELKELKLIYDVNPNGRCIINFNHFLGLMSERKVDLNNFVAKHERILSEEESLLFKDLIDKAELLIERIGQSYNKAHDYTEDSEQDYSKKCVALATKLDNFLKEYFANDLEQLNVIIRDIDNKFRGDIHN